MFANSPTDAREGKMLYIVTALSCEAKPLISYYKLKSLNNSLSFPVYISDKITLIISGVGKISSASSVSYLQGLYNAQKELNSWINIGIAGHEHFPIGTGILAHKVSDSGSERSWYPYPPPLFKVPLKSAWIITYDQVTNQYPKDAAADMEASGFYSTASRFSTLEFVHCYKIISDNAKNHSKNIHKKAVENLIEKQMGNIDSIVSAILSMEEKEKASFCFPKKNHLFLEKWHFTCSERHQLDNLLKKIYVCTGEMEIPNRLMESFHKGKEVLQFLEKKLSSLILDV